MLAIERALVLRSLWWITTTLTISLIKRKCVQLRSQREGSRIALDAKREFRANLLFRWHSWWSWATLGHRYWWRLIVVRYITPHTDIIEGAMFPEFAREMISRFYFISYIIQKWLQGELIYQWHQIAGELMTYEKRFISLQYSDVLCSVF